MTTPDGTLVPLCGMIFNNIIQVLLKWLRIYLDALQAQLL
jgi:ABC-type enterochelin transport system permease subunit